MPGMPRKRLRYAKCVSGHDHPRIASTEVLPDALVASPEMLPAIAHAIMPTPLLWRGYGYQDDARGACRTYQRSP